MPMSKWVMLLYQNGIILHHLHYGKLQFWIQARIAQLVAYRLGTGEVPGSNPGKGDNFSVKISNRKQHQLSIFAQFPPFLLN